MGVLFPEQGGTQWSARFSEPFFPFDKVETTVVSAMRIEKRIQEVTGLRCLAWGLDPGSQPLTDAGSPSLCPSSPLTPSLSGPLSPHSSPVLPSVIPKVRPHHRIISNYM